MDSVRDYGTAIYIKWYVVKIVTKKDVADNSMNIHTHKIYILLVILIGNTKRYTLSYDADSSLVVAM